MRRNCACVVDSVLTVYCSEAGGRKTRCSVLASPLPLFERYRLAVTTLTSRPLNDCHRRRCRPEFKRLKIFITGQIYRKNVGTRIETILHIVLKFEADRACLNERIAVTNFYKKVELEERKKETPNRASTVTGVWVGGTQTQKEENILIWPHNKWCV